MLDIHCHILPGIDDGCANWEEALEMAHIASEDGIKRIIATPHFIRGSYEPTVQEILLLTEELNQRIIAEDLDLIVFPGMEVYLEPDLPQMLKAHEVLTLNGAGKYLLVELPTESIPAHSERVFFELRLMGIMPIIAHAERNEAIASHPEVLFPLVERGLLTQVTTASLNGQFGSKCQEAANYLLNHKLAHFVASDAHYLPGRMPKLREALEKIKETMPEIYSLLRSYEIDFKAGRYIVPDEPIPPETKKKDPFRVVKRWFGGKV